MIMAATAEWFAGQDGSLTVGDRVTGVTYHSTLNSILVTTKAPNVQVLDVTSGSLLQKSDLSAPTSSEIECVYLPLCDKVLFSDGHAVGLRKDLSGVLLLDTALQSPLQSTEDVVKIELPLPEANHLYKSLMSAELPGVDFVEDVLKELENEISTTLETSKDNHKVLKWAAVCLKLPLSALKTVCHNLMMELKRLNQNVPALPVASAITERLNALVTNAHSSAEAGIIDFSLMYSEAARRETFCDWPHMNYKWALPDPMAQAGFYHQPNSTGDDRARCFTCNVCLVCWEPTDEPWSEHERHSPSCPFVKGEYTRNVPLSITHATQPAMKQGYKIECVSTTMSTDLVATSSVNGNIVVWNVSRQLKKELQFNLDPSSMFCTEGATEKTSETGNDKKNDTVEASLEAAESNGMSAAVADEATPVHPPPKTEPVKLTRPSQDVLVSSLCILAESHTEAAPSASASPAKAVSKRPSLLIGASIRKNVDSLAHDASVSMDSDVLTMNEVNHAMSVENTQPIITDEESAIVLGPETEVSDNPFRPILVIHSISRALPAKAKTSDSNKASQMNHVAKKDIYMSHNMAQIGDEDMYDDIGFDTVMPGTTKFSTMNLLTPSSMKFISTSGLKESSDMEGSSSKENKPSIGKLYEEWVDGTILQCVELPEPLRHPEYYISSITPALDDKHVLVVVNLRSAASKAGLKAGLILPGRETDIDSGAELTPAPVHFGCVLIYRLKYSKTVPFLEETPVKVHYVSSIEESVSSIFMLPLELGISQDDEDLVSSDVVSSAKDDAKGLGGQFAAITKSGCIRILRLATLQLLIDLTPPEGDRYVSLTYCTGMDRLCAATEEGKLHFIQVGPRGMDFPDNGLMDYAARVATAPDTATTTESRTQGSLGLLVDQQLTTENMAKLHELTLFENLMPRFSATLPPCWNEIQQEQQQRRHPQHLQQQGEVLQHTRTWKLQQDGTSWDEHLFEIALPRPGCVGHIDMKFTLHPLCTERPNIQVTLLSQNISKIGRGAPPSSSTIVKEESTDDNNSAVKSNSSSGATASASSDSTTKIFASKTNNVLEPEFLEKYNAEVLCGPLDLISHVDLSSQNGLITLTSPQLLKTMSRSFLIHIKALLTDKELEKDAKKKSEKVHDKSKKTTKVVSKPEVYGQFQFPSFYTGPKGATVDQVVSNIPKQKLEDVKGCDWLQEISVTIRKPKKTATPINTNRFQRAAMLDNAVFHRNLVNAVCSKDSIPIVTSLEHRQGLALDILCWVAAIQMNEPVKMKNDKPCIGYAVQAELLPLVKACFIDSGRTIAHKCAKLLVSCIRHMWNFPDKDAAPIFNRSLLQALLACLPSVLSARSAGSIRWFFTLLNHVKSMDVGRTAEICAELLSSMSKAYSERMTDLHAILRTKFGLYGSPCEPTLFDVEPLATKPASSAQPPASATPMSYAQAVTTVPPMPLSSNIPSTQSSASSSTFQSPAEDVDFQDLLLLSSKSSTRSSQCNSKFYGLLEVEPLHFVCHATSDGTKMEKVDSGANSTSPAGGSSGMGTSGVMSFLSSNALPSTAAGAALNSLSSAMASAEQQLHQLQQKTNTLMKLQQQKQKLEQKLAETKGTMGSSGSTSLSSTPPGYAWHETLPPTPKSTPLFMTPPVTPPNEVQPLVQHIAAAQTMPSVPEIGSDPLSASPPKSFNKMGKGTSKSSTHQLPKSFLGYGQTSLFLQHPAPHVLVIERMHSGARRFVVLDFGRPILLTDVLIPACSELASLSIDTWCEGEEIDGHRLVIAQDISSRSLVMKDLLPPPMCRYLKITTVGRYGAGTSRSRIPIGSFYGYSFILPWEVRVPSKQGHPSGRSMAMQPHEEAQVLAHLSMLLGLQEDIQCRYNLACSRVHTLVQGIDLHSGIDPQSSNSEDLIACGKKKDDKHILQALYDCSQLQLQLNQAQRAIERLQGAVGIAPEGTVVNSSNLSILLKNAPTDKLRVMTELLLDVLLRMTNATPSIPRVPKSMYLSCDPVFTERLFKSVCIIGTRHMQVSGGMLLLRVCHGQPWWGEFLGNILLDLFSSEQTLVFPKDRVFILLSALGQRSLVSDGGSAMVESLLTQMTKLLSPLLSNQQSYWRQNASLDLPLVTWMLLFLSRILDNTTSSIYHGNAADDDSSTKSKENGTLNRWDYLQGDSAMQSKQAQMRTTSSKIYRRKLHKRLIHHKQHLLNLEQAKKNYVILQKGGNLSKDVEVALKVEGHGANKKPMKMLAVGMMKPQDAASIQKCLKQYSSKHLKDIIQIRRTDGELLRKLPKDSDDSNGGESVEPDVDFFVTLPRDKCMSVIRGLVSLILALDFSCNVDLFLVACKVIAKITTATRPAITLSEAMNQEQLEKLLLLCANVEYNHGNVNWGGPWAGHTIVCLLQDILEAEKMFPATSLSEGITDDEVSNLSASEESEGSQNDRESPPIDDNEPSTSIDNGATAENGATSGQPKGEKYDKETSLIMDMLLDDAYDDVVNAKLHEYITGEPKPAGFSATAAAAAVMPTITTGPPDWKSTTYNDLSSMTNNSGIKASGYMKEKYEALLASHRNGNTGPPRVSTALDARLEYGVDCNAELRLKFLASMEIEDVHSSLIASLPPCQVKGNGSQSPASAADDSPLSETPIAGDQYQNLPSWEMLSISFDQMFSLLQLHCVNIDTILKLWLALNEDIQDDTSAASGGAMAKFESARIPSIPLNQSSVTSLLAALAWSPEVSVHTWVLAFQALTLLSRRSGDWQERWVGRTIIGDPNLLTVLLKFMSSSYGNPVNGASSNQIGPSGVAAFHKFLTRFHLRCDSDGHNLFKELLLKLVYKLCLPGGAFFMGHGPLDAQCKLLEHILEQNFDSVDTTNAISVIEVVSTLVHQFILVRDRVSCRSSTSGKVNPRRCFVGVLGGMEMTSGGPNYNELLCDLLRLVNLLVQVVLPGGSNANHQNGATADENATHAGRAARREQPMTDSGKISMSRPGQVSKSDEEKMSETDEQKTEAGPEETVKKSREPRDACLSDVVLSHEQIMSHLLQSLSHCGSVLGTNTNLVQDVISQEYEPVTVGDGVYQILCTLNKKASTISLVLRPILNYLSSGFRGIRASTICRLSEPVYWFLIQVLDCDEAFEKFLDLGAIQIICQNLVNTSRRVISAGPSLISTIMHHLGTSSKANLRIKKNGVVPDTDGLQNYAPLGTISSSSPTAAPADILIQSSPPHRRARTAAWSYHFYPEESWMALTIQLPCAILLKEVHIQPHISSLATSPLSVIVEVSPNGSTPVPISAPIATTGLSMIRLHLNKPEVASMITIRLQKPRDTTTLGLAQILLMGVTAFGTPDKPQADDIVAATSVCWLRLLHHFLARNETIAAQTAFAAASTPNLLKTCTALMLAPSSGLFSENAKVALLKLGLHQTEMGLAVIDNLLRNASLSSEDQSPCLYGKTNGIATDSTTDLIYALGTHQDDGTDERVQALCDWLGDSARVALQRSSIEKDDAFQRPSPRISFIEGLPNPSPAHVHCIAAILWHSVDLGISYDLSELVSRELLSSMYEWSMTMSNTATLKKAVDTVICSMCRINPNFFYLVMEWMGIVSSDAVNLDSSLCDDQKDSQQQHKSMTDDSKQECQASGEQAVALQDFGLMFLDETHLSTLAMACRSSFAISQLLCCGFPTALTQALVEFCTREISRHDASGSVSDAMTDSVKSSSRSPRGFKRRSSSESVQSQTDKYLCITADLVAPVLNFLTEAAKEPAMKDWLGEPEGNIFWSQLLNMLCNTASPTHCMASKSKVMSDHQRAAVEAATVTFFCEAVAGHSTNQLLFAQALCDVIKGQEGGHLGDHSPLSGFTRRLFLQVLLEDEKIMLVLESAAMQFKDQSTASNRVTLHPRYGSGHSYRVQVTSLQTTCEENVNKLKDTMALAKEAQGKSVKSEAKSMLKDATELGLEMVDYLSTAAGYQAKEKRDKDKSNRASTSRKTKSGADSNMNILSLPTLSLYHHLLPGQALPGKLTLSQLLVLLHERGIPQGQTVLHVDIAVKSRKRRKEKRKALYVDSEWRDPSVSAPLDDDIPTELLLEAPCFQSPLQVFASIGGLSLLAEHLPLLYPEITRQASPTDGAPESSTNQLPDWVTVESAEDIYDEPEDVIIPSIGSQSRRQTPASMPTIPPHSLVAFGLFLRLPGYAEVLLKERKRAQCLLRLVLGVTDDGEGGHILTSSIAGSLPALPFHVLRTLLDSAPLTTDDGVLLRRMTLEIGALHLLLACLSVLSHHAPRTPIPGFHQEIILAATQASTATTSTCTAVAGSGTTDERGQLYWAKGTGFGTGSTTSSWDAEQALLRQKSEEEHVTCLLMVLASYINPGGQLPKDFESPTYHEEGSGTTALPDVVPELLNQSCLIPSISSYLRNDSVLDMARHVPLYRALLELLRGLAACHALTHLLLPLDKDDKDTSGSVSSLLEKMKQCVDTYANRLKGGKNGKKPEDEESEGLALLIPDIQETARICHIATERIKKEEEDQLKTGSTDDKLGATSVSQVSIEEKYMEVMKELQFDTYEMVSDEDGTVKFKMPHHYESYVKAAGEVGNPGRARRLAQEAVTLSTSLPLSASTTLFVRCDEDRLDVMKVLITAPSETPYSNGCFEFDVFFPQDYPNSPPLVNLETTGNHTVRFNPNLYNDGKVCLSILNTWHGRPEEKWNAQTSSFLQVLVSIQSLILVAEPYFNEPGYERSRGTPSGNASSREYDANIRQATVRWGMLEQLRNPSPCFKEVIQKHFWLKRQEVCHQIEGWIAEMEATTSDKRSGRPISLSTVALKRHYNQLKEELMNMKAPEDLEGFGAFSQTDTVEAKAKDSVQSELNDNANNANTNCVDASNQKVSWGATYTKNVLQFYGNEDDTNSAALDLKMDLVDQLASSNSNSQASFPDLVDFEHKVSNLPDNVSVTSTFGSLGSTHGSSIDGGPAPECEDMMVESDSENGQDSYSAEAAAEATVVDSLSDDAKMTGDAASTSTSEISLADYEISEVPC